jgi:hypothetical protein
MKLIFNLKQYINFEKVLSYTLVFILSLMCLSINIIQQAIGAESLKEPHISLKVNNQRLGDVLEEITLDTGFEFKLNDQWSAYPVNASIENMPLNRGLKLILQGLNHAIIYESDKSIKIMVFGKVDSRKTNSSPVQPSSSQIQDNQQELPLSPESSPEGTDDLKGADDSSEKTGPAAGAELDQDSNGQSEDANEQNDPEDAAEDAPPESPQEQN